MTVLIVEGVDLSGKTTAIEQIAKRLNQGFILKNTYKPREPGDSQIYHQYWNIIKLIKNYDDLVILDRFYPSQAVYSYLRGEDEMYHEEIMHIEDHCKANNYLLLYLDTDTTQLRERYNKKGDEHVNFQQILEIKRRYETFVKECGLPTLIINTIYPGWLKEVEEFIYEHKQC